MTNRLSNNRGYNEWPTSTSLEESGTFSKGFTSRAWLNLQDRRALEARSCWLVELHAWLLRRKKNDAPACARTDTNEAANIWLIHMHIIIDRRSELLQSDVNSNSSSVCSRSSQWQGRSLYRVRNFESSFISSSLFALRQIIQYTIYCIFPFSM